MGRDKFDGDIDEAIKEFFDDGNDDEFDDDDDDSDN